MKWDKCSQERSGTPEARMLGRPLHGPEGELPSHGSKGRKQEEAGESAMLAQIPWELGLQDWR